MSRADISENHVILIQDQENQNEYKKEVLRNSVLLKTGAFGFNGLFLASHLVLNGKFLSSIASEGTSASALMSTYQSVILGSGIGFLLATGLDFGTAVGKKEFLKGGDIAKTAVVLSAVLGIFSASAMLSTRGIFPLIFENKTAKITSDFFTGYAAASLPLLFLIVAPQVAFQEGEWYIPPAAMLSLLVTGGASSYLLGFKANLGALGVGLGGTVGALITAVCIGMWFFRENYQKYDLHSLQINEFSQKMKSLLMSGWKLALQRLTEWGNLFLITTIVGARNNSDLKALNPAMLYLILFGTAQQGLAQAAGMLVSKNKGVIQKAIQDDDKSIIEESHHNNIKTVFRSNLFGLITNSTLAASFYFGRKPLAGFFLSDNESTDVENLAQSLLFLNMFGLISDSCRIIGAGALRGWKDFLYPTLVSFVCMSVIGVPTAYGLGTRFSDEARMMVYARNVAMLLSAAFILARCYNNLRKDESIELSNYLQPASFFKISISSLCPSKKSEFPQPIEEGFLVYDTSVAHRK